MTGQDQEYRLIRLNTALGYGMLLVEKFEGREELSEPFQFKIQAFSKRTFVDFNKIIGQPIVLSIVMDDAQERYFHGFVHRFSRKESREGVYRYEIEMVPHITFLDKISDCRIFQNQNSRSIVSSLLEEYAILDVEWRVSTPLAEREYCVQYNESTLHFINRLLAEDGLFYFFIHHKHKHVMVIVDNISALMSCPAASKIRYHRSHVVEEDDTISLWEETASLQSGSYGHGDYNFKTPLLDLTTHTKSLVSLESNKDLEWYHYPGLYQNRKDGEHYSKLRTEYLETSWRVIYGEGNVLGMLLGHCFTLQEHYDTSTNKRYAITMLTHKAENNFGIDNEVVEGAYYSNSFNCIDSETSHRFKLLQKPHIHSLQTALVVGGKDDEIYTDEYGRIKVQFHWDRRGKYNENSSCWVRVAQSVSGKNWGAFFLPRVGMEVLVDFEEGNSDRPIVIGTVPNAHNMPPYALPQHKTRSTFKSHSTPKAQGFNEVRFEDLKDEEQIFIHAQKNMDKRIKHDSREEIGNDRHIKIMANDHEYVEESRHVIVKGDFNERTQGDYSHSFDNDMHHKAGAGYAVKAGREIKLEAGNVITLQVGGNFIKVDRSGITLSGAMVKINSGGSPGGLTANPQSPQMAQSADNDKSGKVSELPPEKKVPQVFGKREKITQRETLKRAASNNTPFCEICQEG